MSRKAGLGMMTVAWIMLFLMAIAAVDEWLNARENPNRQPVAAHNENGERRVVLQANRQHQYLVGAHIDGHPVTLLIDTGATEVVVPQALARQLGLPRGPASYAITANGRVRVYSTRIEEIIIGAIILRDIPAAINPGMAAQDAVLLGMSALSTIELRQRDGELLMIQPAAP